VGRWAELVNYCLEDVLLTRELGHFIAREGYVYDRDGERLLLEVPAWYKVPEKRTIVDGGRRTEIKHAHTVGNIT
jgi:hypothetical protein